ncbi:hypothetical protein H072_8969 [Dactylellina haptotyla CBS 200.50]|uniref:beta-glucosidase n=1 Tax=Dactylellina haptotyla (strain CBS 200.50) TaxID=1284197 RepID=S8A303_DACHA|nr:hypothetical protein H072_8969 [Dactylellina haptotyla CBS 200.50]
MAPSKASVLGNAVLLLSALAGAQEPDAPIFYPRSPPAYPAPIGTGKGLPEWSEAYSKAQAIVAQMTIAEKGIRFGLYSSAFPAGVTIASTWDDELAYRRGFAMGMEHRGKGVDVQLGPVSGPLGLFPEGGRNWEGGGSDPFLSGVGLAAAVRGIQDAGVIACAKHYIGGSPTRAAFFGFKNIWNSSGSVTDFGFFYFTMQPMNKGESVIPVNQSISSNVDDRTLHEVYAWPFADAVRAGVGSIMCSYNQINNSYGCQNSELMNGILKNELGFPGFVMSDWQAQHAGVATALAGLGKELELPRQDPQMSAMPGDQVFVSGNAYWGANLTIAVLNGTVPTWRLDDMATRIMASFYKVGLDKDRVDVNLDSWTTDVYGFENWFAKENYRIVNGNVDVRGTHATLIREVAAKGTVLLKNNGSLPLGRVRQIAVFGSDATDNPRGPNGCPDRGCADGTVAMGWGSGTANFPYLISPLTALQNKAYADGTVIQWVVDDWATTQMKSTATQAETCLVFVKAQAGEAYITVDGNQGDRNNLTLWANGEQVIKTVADNCKNTIVTIHAPGPVTMEEWIDHPNVTAVLYAGLPGQESGNSIVDVLYGLVEPGRLPFTIAKNASDYGVELMYEPNNSYAPQQNFTSGLLIDYRYFDKKEIEPRFEFGFGLSYTTWKYSNLQVQKLNAGSYGAFNGRTPAATSGNVTETPDSLLFPTDFHQIPYYIYPYLNNTSDGLEGNGTKGPSDAYDPTGTPIRPAGGAPGGHPGLYDILYQVNVTVSNTGKRNGEEIVQMYVCQGEEDDPVRVLRGFRRISVDAGGTTNVIFTILRRDISRWDVVTQNWVISSATKTVYIGRSSRDLPLSAKLE